MRIRKVEWLVAFRQRKADVPLLFEEEGSLDGFVVAKNSMRYWCADPFLFKHNGIQYLFFEAYDRLKRRGVIGYRTIKDSKVSKIKIIYRSSGHLSYPFIYVKDDEIYIMPESSSEHVLFNLKCVSFPDKWERVGKINDVSLVDTTIYKDYIFTTPVNSESNSRYLVVNKISKGEQSFDNIVIDDKSKARMAGKVFEYNGIIWRPSQDCSKTYGGSLNFNIIDNLDAKQYKEHLAKQIEASSFPTRKFDGLHTYNFDDDYEVVDFKINYKFNIVEVIGYLLSMFKRKS